MTRPRTLRIACVQLTSGLGIDGNVTVASALIRDAAAEGAQLITTPEMTSFLVTRSADLFARARAAEDDPALARFRELAAELGVWLLIGSIAVRVADDKCANRSFLLSPSGDIAAQYDKMHLFDVDLPGGESYRESAHYRAGDTPVVAETPWGGLGLTICYDVRFPALYRHLARAGAPLIAVPSAFTTGTGRAHWHVLLRARAIETGAFVFAPAQSGTHECGRKTYGHSLIVSPWGDVLADAPDGPGLILADLDLAAVTDARARLPISAHEKPIV